MRGAARILAIFGAMAGFTGASLRVYYAGLAGADLDIGRAMTAMALSVVGLVASALCMGRPRVSALLMVVCAVGGAIAVSLYYSVAAALFLIGALLAVRSTEARPVPRP